MSYARCTRSYCYFRKQCRRKNIYPKNDTNPVWLHYFLLDFRDDNFRLLMSFFSMTINKSQGQTVSSRHVSFDTCFHPWTILCCRFQSYEKQKVSRSFCLIKALFPCKYTKCSLQWSIRKHINWFGNFICNFCSSPLILYVLWFCVIWEVNSMLLCNFL